MIRILFLIALVGCRSTPSHYEILEVKDGEKPRFNGVGNQQAFANDARTHRRIRASVEEHSIGLRKRERIPRSHCSYRSYLLQRNRAEYVNKGERLK
jgi:hypothetical protein